MDNYKILHIVIECILFIGILIYIYKQIKQNEKYNDLISKKNKNLNLRLTKLENFLISIKNANHSDIETEDDSEFSENKKEDIEIKKKDKTNEDSFKQSDDQSTKKKPKELIEFEKFINSEANAEKKSKFY